MNTTRCSRPPERDAARPQAASGVASSKWGIPPNTIFTLEVKFTDRPNSPYSALVISLMNQWHVGGGGLRYAETNANGHLRLSSDLAGGSWADIGNDALRYPNDPTINIGLPDTHPDFAGNVIHEAGHTRGYDHTHRQQACIDGLNRTQIYADYASQFGWTPAETDEEVFTLLRPGEIAPPPHFESALCYPFTAAQKLNMIATFGSQMLTATDLAYDAAQYPKPAAPPPPIPPPVPAVKALQYHHTGSAPGLYVYDHVSGVQTRLAPPPNSSAGEPIEMIVDPTTGNVAATFNNIGGWWFYKHGTGQFASINAACKMAGFANI